MELVCPALFLIPFCWFAWRRNLVGIALTIFALASSMFWFPAPDVPSPMALEVLAAEREYLLGPWTWWKVVVALLIPATFTVLAFAFWNRSFGWGLLVVNVIALTKIAWTFVFFTVEGALYHLVPAASGLAICNAVLIIACRLWVRPRTPPGRAPSRP